MDITGVFDDLFDIAERGLDWADKTFSRYLDYEERVKQAKMRAGESRALQDLLDAEADAASAPAASGFTLDNRMLLLLGGGAVLLFVLAKD